ncbi:MAG TPA: hypothetical protein VN873_18215 [Candidatus Angelobacter sp.]|nr:hypothetical protein [Candidatus Angelobacter sp.]
MAEKQKHDGASLERAVKFIQEAILKNDPKLKGIEFTIESNKVCVISGVRHELDVFVKTCPGSPYESSWIFECKNWRKTVGKNEVIILAEKVHALNASKGFLVAKKISKFAEAQIKRDERIKFIRCHDDFLGTLGIELTHSVHNPLPIQAWFKERGVAAEGLRKLKLEDITCRLNNQPINFLSYIEKLTKDEMEVDGRENSTRYSYVGGHWGERCIEVVYSSGECILNGVELESMTLGFRFFVTVSRHKMRSKFELEGHGRMFSFEPIEDIIPGKPLEVVIVQCFDRTKG